MSEEVRERAEWYGGWAGLASGQVIPSGVHDFIGEVVCSCSAGVRPGGGPDSRETVEISESILLTRHE